MITASPLPWLSFEAVSVLLSTRCEGDTLFEYGSGYGTDFWRMFYTVTSVDHSPDFGKYADALYRDEVAYVNALNMQYDVVICDGHDPWRPQCALRAAQFAKKIVIIDDTERESYVPWINAAMSDEWSRHDFHGMKRFDSRQAGNLIPTQTTLFARKGVVQL